RPFDRAEIAKLRPYETTVDEFDPPRHVLLTGTTLLAGYGHGEWGGSLLSLDLLTGRWTKPSGDWKEGGLSDDPITSIVRGPDGVIWLSQGLAHMGGRTGALRRFNAKKWDLFALTDDKTLNWPLPQA